MHMPSAIPGTSSASRLVQLLPPGKFLRLVAPRSAPIFHGSVLACRSPRSVTSLAGDDDMRSGGQQAQPRDCWARSAVRSPGRLASREQDLLLQIGGAAARPWRAKTKYQSPRIGPVRRPRSQAGAGLKAQMPAALLPARLTGEFTNTWRRFGERETGGGGGQGWLSLTGMVVSN